VLPVTAELDAVKRTLASLGMDTRKVRSFGDMKAAAQELGMDPNALKGAASRPISDAEVVLSANTINEAATVHAQATAGLAKAGLTETEELALKAQAEGALKTIQDALKRRIKGGTEAGRAVAAYRIIGERNMDPAYWLTVAQRRLGEGKALPDEVAKAIHGAIAANDRVALARVIAKLGEAGWTDKFIHVWRAGMLSNPGTDVRNVGGTAGFNSALAAADLPANVLDVLVSKATGQRSSSVSLRQGAEYVRGIGAGVKKAGEILRHGDTAEEVLKKYDVGRDVHLNNPILETYTQLVYRRLGAEDALFKEPAKFKVVAELAEVLAKNEGHVGGAYLDRVGELIKTPTEQMLKIADAEAAHATFNAPSAMASWLSSGAGKLGPAGKLGLAATAMFKRTPINVGKAIVEFSPFGMPKAAISLATSRGGTEMERMLGQRYFVKGVGRAVTGTTVMAMGWRLAADGLAHGARPVSTEERNARKAAGITDYSVKVGDELVGINNNAPMANLLMAGVDAYEQFQSDKSAQDKIAGSASALAQGITSQTFLKGLNQTSEAASNPIQYGGSYVANLVASLVPSVVGAVARGSDPNERRIDDPLQAVQARIPGLRQGLEPQVTTRGEERKQQTGVGGQLFSPVRKAPVDSSPLAKAVQSAGWGPDVPKDLKFKTPDGKPGELSADELTAFQKEVGKRQTAAMEGVLADYKGRGLDFMAVPQDRQKYLLRQAAQKAEDSVRDSWRRRKQSR